MKYNKHYGILNLPDGKLLQYVISEVPFFCFILRLVRFIQVLNLKSIIYNMLEMAEVDAKNPETQDASSNSNKKFK